MITYLELLQMVKEGRQPEKIRAFDDIYLWGEGGYGREDNWYLGQFVMDETDRANDRWIEVLE